VSEQRLIQHMLCIVCVLGACCAVNCTLSDIVEVVLFVCGASRDLSKRGSLNLNH